MYTLWFWAFALFFVCGGLVSNPPSEYIDCSLKILAENRGSMRIEIDLSASEVKVKSGGWGDLYYDTDPTGHCDQARIILEPGKRASNVQCELPLGCTYSRRYRFRIKAIHPNGREQSTSFEFPLAGKFTSSTQLNLGNLARLFP